MSDRELVLLAAKAAGVEIPTAPGTSMGCMFFDGKGFEWYRGYGFANGFFMPLSDLGQALKLAIDLNLRVECMTGQSAARTFDSRFAGACDFPAKKDDGCDRDWAPDRYAATCRAIVTAAAEIGRAMP